MVTTGPTERALRTIPVANAAEAFVEMLVHNGVEYLFINSGTDTFPVQEAIARMMEQERATPKLILCIDEVTAMFAAQGYFQVTGRPQVVLVHVDAGTAQIGGAYHDVQRDRSGVIVCAGRAPITIGGVRPGSKDMVIHWGQEQLDQHGIVRTFVKWDYELRTVDSINWVVQKAFQVAASEPAGPVYLTLPRELLMTEMESLQLPPAARHAKPIAPAPDPDAIAALAQWLVDAERPLIIAGTPGRYPEAVAPLTELAETVAAPVAGALHTRLNLPTRHFLNAVSCGAPSVSEADVILVLDHDVPWVPDQETLEPGARVGWIDIDPSKDTIPLWTFPADLLIHAASRKALPVLLNAVRERLTDAARERIAARNDRYHANNERRRQEIARQVEALADKRPIDPLYVAACLEQVLDDETIVVNEGMSGGAPFNAYTDRRAPGSVFGSGGSSLGYGLGASIGVKLAAPDKTVVCLEGDGAFIFARPTSAFWAAEKYDLPFLTIIYNNSSHNATRNSWNKWYPDGAGPRNDNYVAVDIDPSPDYDVLVQACRGYGERVDDPAQVLPALNRALQRVHQGQAAVLDVRIR